MGRDALAAAAGAAAACAAEVATGVITSGAILWCVRCALFIWAHHRTFLQPTLRFHVNAGAPQNARARFAAAVQLVLSCSAFATRFVCVVRHRAAVRFSNESKQNTTRKPTSNEHAPNKLICFSALFLCLGSKRNLWERKHINSKVQSERANARANDRPQKSSLRLRRQRSPANIALSANR